MEELEEDKDSRLFAGLCYIPVCIINLIMIAYVLLAKKGGKYARYHALQGLGVFLVIFVMTMIVQLPFMLIYMSSWFSMMSSPAKFASNFANLFLIMIPMMILGLVTLAVYLVFAYWAFTGKKFRIPIISNQVDRMV